MNIFLTTLLPAGLAFIMFSLGLGLVVDDFRAILRKPFAFMVGAVNQMVLVPIVAFLLALGSDLPGEIRLGIMILAFCPGGVTSNLLTKLAKGEVALAVSLTAVTSIVTIFTIPPLVTLSAYYFLGVNAPPVDVTRLGMSMVMITAVPVIAGMALRHLAPSFATKIEAPTSNASVVLFVLIVGGALAANWEAFITNLPVMGPVLILLNVIMLVFAYLISRLLKLAPATATAVSIETAMHNATLGITIGSLIAIDASALPAFSLASGVYGITSYFVIVPFILWRRRRTAIMQDAPAMPGR
jgi:BASS family bile acid:Na+ symporter